MGALCFHTLNNNSDGSDGRSWQYPNKITAAEAGADKSVR